MMKWLRKHNREIMIFTFCTFILGGVVFTGVQSFAVTPFSAVLVVNGEKVTYKRFETLLQRRLQQQEGAVSDEKLKSLQTSTLQELVQETALMQEAKRYGLQATDAEVAATLQGAPAFQRDGRFDQGLYLNYVAQVLHVSPAAFEEEQRKNVLRQKLLMLISSTVKVSEDEALRYLSRLPEKERQELGKDPQKLRSTISQEQGNAVVQAWLQQINSKLKVENRLDRWGKQNS
jgi:peptidyl-prolyl cis-trans isomerase D